METTQTHTVPLTGQAENPGHLVLATGSASHAELQKLVVDTLDAHHHTYERIQAAPTPEHIANLARESGAQGIIYLVVDVNDRRAVYRLVAYLRHIGWHLPLLLTGPAVEPEYANLLALPQNGQLYQGGIYYCEDAFEIAQVLKQIVLYIPPPSEHQHEDEDPFSCSSCASCGDACTLNTL